jgi:limonene 1,2-monooxygenase
MSHLPIRFGTFLAPFHPDDESPTEQIHRDLELMEHLERFGYDEAWIGEHHSGGYEIIASPEIFIAHAAARTQRIRLGTGVVSLPYHNPLMVAGRMLQLDHQTRGRVMLGVGPGQLPTDAYMIGLDMRDSRRRMTESLEVIMALLRGEEVTRKTDWFELHQARLQLPHIQRPHLEVAVAYGFEQLPKHWQVCEEKAEEHGQSVDRRNWRLVVPMHIAETRERAFEDMRHGTLRLTRYLEKLMGQKPDFADSHEHCIESWENAGWPVFGRLVLGSPDDAIAEIERLRAKSGGFGTLLLLGHNCADPVATRKSYELISRYVMPAVNGDNRARSASLELANEKSGTLIPQLMDALGAATAQHEAERKDRGGRGTAWVDESND